MALHPPYTLPFAPSWSHAIVAALAQRALRGDEPSSRLLGWWTSMRDYSAYGFATPLDEWLHWADLSLTSLAVD